VEVAPVQRNLGEFQQMNVVWKFNLCLVDFLNAHCAMAQLMNYRKFPVVVTKHVWSAGKNICAYKLLNHELT